ncbi:MAG: ATP-grasp domain-containing protein [Eggerthellaceae bacterium]|nr:ATP-grasp domain-containing protein [Eggerthellaceae bacterium]
MNKKKLLLLGGTTSSNLVVETAKGMGLWVGVTDMNPMSPAKKIADAAYDVSTIEIDEIVRLVHDEDIDGIFVAYDDKNTLNAAKVSKKTGLKFYATESQILATRSKDTFKELCRKYGLSTVPEYSCDSPEFPCVVKPVDSYSAKGISICRSREEFDDAVQSALAFSESGNVIIEKYMDPDSCQCVNIEYAMRDGEVKVAAVGDKYVMTQGDHAPITSAVVYPSSYLEEFLASEEGLRTEEMISSEGLKNGFLYIESFYQDGHFYYYEMGYRLGGGQGSVIAKRENDVDLIEMMISYALDGTMGTLEQFAKVDPRYNDIGVGLVLYARPGVIKEISCCAQDVPGVIRVTLFVEEGGRIEESLVGTLGQTAARVHFMAGSRDDARVKIDSIIKAISMISENGEEMIIDYNPLAVSLKGATS